MSTIVLYMRDLELFHSHKFRNLIRTEPETFEKLISTLEPLIINNLQYFQRKYNKLGPLSEATSARIPVNKPCSVTDDVIEANTPLIIRHL
jgi:hypothetical protein